MSATLSAGAGVNVEPAEGASATLSAEPRVPATSIAELATATRERDGDEVLFSGEAVGDIIRAEDGFWWLTLADGDATISVRISDAERAQVTHLGRYDQIGTSLQVRGVFEQDCSVHDGLVDVHATELVVLDPGASVATSFNLQELQVGGLLIFLAALLIILHWRLRERSR